MDDAAKLLTTPRVGVHRNTSYTGIQMNLAVPQLNMSSKSIQ